MGNRKMILKKEYQLRIWQRIILLVILGYEAAGALSGGSLLVASPDGRFMNMSISIMNGFFPDFLIPGIMLIGLGILNLTAFVAVLRRSQIDWLLIGFALGGLAIWFITEIIILQGFHWLHAMWGLPVIAGCLVAFPLVTKQMRNSKWYQTRGIMNLIKKNSILSYFILTFLISWGAILILMAINGMPTTEAEAQAQMPLAIMTFLLGPCISGLVMIGLVNGRAGYRNLVSRLLKWRFSLVWYAVALMLAPAVFAVTQLILSLISPVFLPGFLTAPDSPSLIFLGIMSGIMVGILEEVGWFGFVIPQMRQRFSPLKVGLIVGLIWGAWHIMANDIWAIKTYAGEIPTVLYAILSGLSFLIGQLPPFRVLMIWAYERTGSLSLMMVMHFSLTACSITFAPTTITGWNVFIYSLAVAAVFWVIAAAVVLVDRFYYKRRNERSNN